MMKILEQHDRLRSKCDQVLSVFGTALQDKTKKDTHFKIRKAIDKLLDLRNQGEDLDPLTYDKNLKAIVDEYISYVARDRKTHKEVEDMTS